MTSLSIGGMGGFELGFRAAGYDISPVGFCEREKLARCVLRREWPSAMTYYSISGIQNVKRRSIDLICGKLGADDYVLARDRQRLATAAGRGDELARLVRTLEPALVILEIESGLLTAGRGERMQSLLAQAAGWLPAVPRRGWGTAGLIKPRPDRKGTYGAVWRVLDLRCLHATIPESSAYRQSRERLYIVLKLGEAPAAEVLLDEEDVAGIFGSIRGANGEEQEGGNANHTGEENAGMDEGGINPFVMYDSGIPFDGRVGGFNSSPIVPRNTLPTMHGQNVAFAIEAEKRIRWATPEEVELGYTLPHRYTATGMQSKQSALLPIEIKDAPRYRMLGRDTVPPAMIEWIARRIAA
jgi:site-specific DNA-cytosine methylase